MTDEEFATMVLRKIDDERRRRDLNQDEMAKRLGWTQSKVAQKLNQKTPTTLQELHGLCSVVGLSHVEVVRDPELEFAADLTPLEMRTLKRLRQLVPEARNLIIAFLETETRRRP